MFMCGMHLCMHVYMYGNMCVLIHVLVCLCLKPEVDTEYCP